MYAKADVSTQPYPPVRLSVGEEDYVLLLYSTGVDVVAARNIELGLVLYSTHKQM